MSESGGLRARLNGSPMLSAAAVVVIVLIAVGVWMFTHPPVTHGEFFYSDDDGKTYFAGPVAATPFLKDGKQVVEAHVFTCNGGKPFVGYLQRYPDDVRERVAQQFKQVQPGRLPPAEVKRPGDADWTKMAALPGPSDGKPSAPGLSADAIMKPTCPDGKFAIPKMPGF